MNNFLIIICYKNNATLNYTNAKMTSSNNINFMNNTNNNNNLYYHHNNQKRSRSRSNSTGAQLINENNKRRLNDNLIVSDLTLERNPKKGRNNLLLFLCNPNKHGRHILLLLIW